MDAKEILKQIAELAGVQYSTEVDKQADNDSTNETDVKLDDSASQVADQMPAENQSDMNKTIEELTARVLQLETALQQIVEQVSMTKEANTKLSAIVDLISKQPIAEPVTRTSTLELSSQSEDDKYKIFVNARR